MHLTKSQKYQLAEIIAEAGLEPSRFVWTSKEKLPKPWQVQIEDKRAQCYLDTVTQNLFAFGTLIEKRPRMLNIFPWGVSLQDERSVTTWEDTVKLFSLWIQRTKLDEANLVEWPDSCQVAVARESLALEVVNLVGRALRDASLNLEWFDWGRTQNGALLRFPNDTAISFELVHSSAELFHGRLAPADRTSKKFSVSGLDALRATLSEWIDAVKEHLSVPDKLPSPRTADGSAGPLPFRISHIELENIRGFRHFQWTDHTPVGTGENSLVVIGTNGTGKSTLLRAIALTLLPEPQAAHLIGYPLCRMLRRGAEGGRITIQVRFPDQETREYVSVISRTRDDGEAIESQSSPVDLDLLRVYAYGSGRATDGTVNSDGSPKRRAVLSLFDYKTPLADPDTLLLRLSDEESAGICARYATLIGLTGSRPITVRERGQVWIKEGDVEFPLKNWADGYRLTFQWYLDLWYSCLQFGEGKLDVQRDPVGLLMVDELALHLHPNLQSSLLGNFTKSLPNLFCIFTTHSPLVTLGLPSNRLLVLQKDGGAVSSSQPRNTQGYTVEDLITDPEIFNTSPYSAQKTEDLAAWRDMMKKAPHEMTPEERESFAELTQRVMTQ